jgi:hypothetical protein
MGRLSGRAQWGVILGAWFGYQILRNIANRNPSAAKFLWPILLAYIVFVVMTWLAGPLLNLVLRLHRFGRYALSREQIIKSNWIGGLLAVAIISASAAAMLRSEPLITLAVVSAFMVMPMSSAFTCERGWPRNVMFAIAALLALIGICAVLIDPKVQVNQLGVNLLIVFVIGVVVSSFLMHALRMVKPRA